MLTNNNNKFEDVEVGDLYRTKQDLIILWRGLVCAYGELPKNSIIMVVSKGKMSVDGVGEILFLQKNNFISIYNIENYKSFPFEKIS